MLNLQVERETLFDFEALYEWMRNALVVIYRNRGLRKVRSHVFSQNGLVVSGVFYPIVLDALLEGFGLEFVSVETKCH